MKQMVIFLVTGMSALFLAGCQATESSDKDSAKDKEESVQQVQKQTIDKNKTKWDSEVAKAKKIDVTSIDESSSYIFPSSIKEFKDYKSLLIKGTVVNYKQLSYIHNEAYTKASIKIDAVLLGSQKSLEGKTVDLILHGGLTKSSDYLFGMNDLEYNGVAVVPNSDEELYIHDTDAPLPAIGSSIITDINYVEYDDHDSTDFANAMRVNKIKSKTVYRPNAEQFTLWVKDVGAKEYVLNNENQRNNSDPNDLSSETTFTKSINDTYNN
ncbi:hypothetical protein [Companilactobacillus jidongensis]|uniref:hypothetical protein n=1 Tax=Companilactobacillus jidongensis TaxID=2486006 RepID=UPI000F76DFE2|nr:hypothetical protein [Companilactobacillus jidongensis]